MALKTAHRFANKKENTIADHFKVVAVSLFSEHGVGNVSVANLCREAGYANGTFYNFFRSKEDLLEELIDDAANLLIGRLGDANQQAADGAELVHRRDVEIIVDLVEQYAEIFQFLLAVRGSGRIGRSRIDALAEQRTREMQRYMDQGVFSTNVLANLVARAEIGIMSDVLNWWIAEDKPINREDLINQLVTIRLGLTNPTFN